jgi:hypothetical protein
VILIGGLQSRRGCRDPPRGENHATRSRKFLELSHGVYRYGFDRRQNHDAVMFSSNHGVQGSIVEEVESVTCAQDLRDNFRPEHLPKLFDHVHAAVGETPPKPRCSEGTARHRLQCSPAA